MVIMISDDHIVVAAIIGWRREESVFPPIPKVQARGRLGWALAGVPGCAAWPSDCTVSCRTILALPVQ